ncbi:uncharacterized protein LOC112601423 [Melanaphis sacchari]|uniref:uncharacterized protein LOC112601423 n=1 Tax=Melanaphis sacchari TaxID=742174 RepID=UPI000DC156F9|nr:uncharacterized protein LOC112601423 [Melanaphis sacchari]
MDEDRAKRSKKRALAKRATVVDRIKSIFDLGVSGESDPIARQKFLIAVDDLTDLWGKFVIENDAVLEALIELGEEDNFSSSVEVETNEILVSARAMANRFSSVSNKSESSLEAPRCARESEAAGSSDSPSKSVEGQALVTPVIQSSHSVRLPEIPLPRFEGELADWPVFRDRFIALVDSRSNISNIEKFYYLLSCLQCEASDVVKGITVSNDTYSIAWAALVERYDQPRRLASSLIDSILSAPEMQQESVASLNKFLCTFDENIAILESLEIPNLGDFLLFSVAFRSLPVLSRRLFETTNQDEYPKAQDLFKFVKNRIQVLQLAGGSSSVTNAKSSSSKPQKKWSQKPTVATSLTITKSSGAPITKTDECPNCKESHHLSNCSAFKDLTVDGRYEVVSKHRLCMSCFSSLHWSNKCKETCPKCKRRHHQLLHRDVHQSQNKTVEQSPAVLFGSRSTPSVLLGTAVVFIKDSGGEIQPVRAIIDSGSQISVITAKCSDRLGLRRSRWTASVTGLSGQSVPDVLGTVDLTVRPRHDTAPVITMKAWVLPAITADMPNRRLIAGIRESCSHLKLADPHFDTPAPVELLLGADVFPQVWIGEQRQLGHGLPSAYSSVFGWVLIGPVFQERNLNACCMFTTLSVSMESLMERFWKVEEPDEAPLQFTDEGYCEDRFAAKSTIDTEGRYSVPLPFRRDQLDPTFDGMHKIAVQRFEYLERRLNQNKDLGVAYRNFMKEYEALGHMSVAKNPGRYIIPHHAVWKQESGKSKLRVVFDASARSASGKSLNDTLYVGPKLQRDIVDVLLGFRLYRFAFSTDICKMYRQIKVNADDRGYQHILWRATPVDALKEFELNTVTYGVNSAPFLALRVLHDIADRCGTQFPSVQKALRLQTYMDDICTGAATLDEAGELRHNLVKTLENHGFELKKWSSSTPELLEGIPGEDCASGTLSFDDEGTIIRVLGLNWNSEEDSLGYDFSSIKFVHTKRGVLSVIARIYDPLGFLAPVLLFAKHIMQLIWLSGIAWDDRLPLEIEELWSQLVSDLPSLSLIRIPRFVGIQLGSVYNLCGFCDASVRGYAALIYLRIVSPDGQVKIRFLGSKTKLAPLHDMTVPRLELCGAGLLARWMARVWETLTAQLMISKVYAWTDSSIVLSWLTTPQVSYKIFVSNRINKINQLLPDCKWLHVPSEDNPADCASRGLKPSELRNHNLYWNGPRFLYNSVESWPFDLPRVPIEQLPEIKVNSFLISSDQNHEWFDRFSSYQHMLRVIVWVRRFVSLCKKRLTPLGPISFVELNEALMNIVRCSQSVYLHSLRKELSQKSRISCKQLARLSPFLDSEGIIRVGGRLNNSQIPARQKHPILLAKMSYLSRLIVRHWHVFSCHSGNRLVMYLISKQFWILSARRVIGSEIENCIICVRLSAVNPQPIMADLPASRVLQCRPFSKVGIDFAGPLLMKELKLRKAREYKVYISVFVCMTVKAVHLEIVSDLSTPAFLAALDRFVARRGLPSDIYSDCGTNFVGASKQLCKFFSDAKVQDHLSSHFPCSWHFNPPSAPHFGGLWEAAVRSMKRLLVRVVGAHILTYEELTTVVCRIESVLNSRPLTPLSSDPGDLESLTPGHFLIGQPLLSVPESDVLEAPSHLTSRWKLLHQCYQAFWKRWSSEYLNSLQLRSKWTSADTQLRVGDLVLIKDSSTPLSWRLGRVVELLPGQDNVVRVVKLLTGQGPLVRPVVKLVRLPTE